MNLQISALPIDIAKSDVNANLQKTVELLDLMPKGTDIAVLPELFSTGFIKDVMEASSLGEENSIRTIEFILKQAKDRNCAICGSYLALDNQKLYNRAFFAEPCGDVAFYDKRHLFSLSDEASVFTAGNRLAPIIRFRGWNVSMAICYDVRFPAWIRNQNLKYDALLVPANWPEKRSFAWTHLLQGRAIENQAYIVGANRSGSDKFGEYTGQTYIYDYKGESIGTFEGPLVNAVLHRESLDNFREEFAFWRDSDRFNVII